MAIDGNRVCGPRGERRGGGRLAGGVDRRNDLDQGLALRVDDAEHGACWVGAGGGVVPSIAGVEPDFVGSPNSPNVRIDCARFCVHDDLFGRSGMRIRRTPHPSAVSKTTLQPRSRSWCGPRASPAGWQNFTRNVASTTSVWGLI